MELTQQKYKETEAGLIPEDWTLEKIEDFASITTGGSDTQDRVKDGEYPFYVRSNTIERINKYSFDGEAILTSGDGVGVGKIFHYVTGKFDYHQRVYNLFNYRQDVYGKYLFFQFSTNFYKKVMSMTAKSSVDSVRREMIADMKIPLPPTLEEQKAIAAALSDVDELISNLNQLITKKKAIKQGAMQQLLTPPNKGGKRLAGFTEDWDFRTIGELCKTFTKQTGFDYSNHIKPTLINKKQTDYLPFIQNKDFNGHKVNFDTDYYIPQDVAVRFPMILLNERCLMISISGSIGKVGIFNNKEIAFIGGAVSVGKFINPLYLDWVMNYLHSEAGQNMMLKDVKAGSHQNLILDDIRKMKIPMPKIEEQNAVCQILSDINEDIDKLETKKAKYQVIKQGMMQELLTGKIRLV
ncbi:MULTISPECIES: restriction endonuclease subunit S [unclassified Flavobacterium]|uniref:restriction endonuclease subunit S n=1 Tax=unclassified Flavobacterium TaxID=196869 RepID=UPI00131D31F5|nr:MULTISPECIES: restriction endonuclease subunit S [unclassified Flavobacterium]